ncbi:MAG: tricarballylate utilization 4Fe-4S protein TcuB [Paracoccaceae bacterium]|nr:tricarballylate utilization 4Fe-4S protein TcuB [Paracoccaceae bacterium]
MTLQKGCLHEVRRQLDVCGACHYCDGYCDVFPALKHLPTASDGDIVQLANLCHNCRGCFYSCQYTPPHAFAVDIPAILAEARTDSWNELVWPTGSVRLFQMHGSAVALVLAGSVAMILVLIRTFAPSGGEGIYRFMPHALLVAIFMPAFLGPLMVVALSTWRYFRAVGADPIRVRHFAVALLRAARLDNLSGGQGQGCNFEDTGRFSGRRRFLHQMAVSGFVLCFCATVAGTILHYGFGEPAPYGPTSLPKLLGITGGLLLTIGAGGLAQIKHRGDRRLGDARVWTGEMAFVLLLLVIAASGLALWGGAGTVLSVWLLSLHLGAVLTFFILMPYSKMIHGAFRLAALVVDAQRGSASV